MCVCVCVSLCACVCESVSECVCVYVRGRESVCAYVCARVCVCVDERECACARGFMLRMTVYVEMWVCVRVPSVVSIQMHACMCGIL